ncbi:AAA family ATPase [Aureimonas altamirensis]|uniref:AAA family ATPase n=1 Tax=Aureimonas altamirensis TaxID=370622 RepID=UPI0009E7B7DA
MGEVRRQRESWQRDATRDLATGRTEDAIDAYARHDSVHSAATRNDARHDGRSRRSRNAKFTFKTPSNRAHEFFILTTP